MRLRDIRRQIWQPPRPHGEVIEDRSVSFLELFYDLVYVVVIARAAHHLASDITWRSVADFVVVFTLIWIAWLNGTMYHELHGRNDVRSRFFIFVQMLLLATLAVFTADAGGDDGTSFALTYALFLGVMIWLWVSVWRIDEPNQRTTSTRFIIVLVISAAAMVASVALQGDRRLTVWAVIAVVSVAVTAAQRLDDRALANIGITESMVERFGLFTIIVLGEVVVGVVDGLSEAERSATTVATGLFALVIGFGYWWSYFDFVSRRLPSPEARSFYLWLPLHLPTTLGIAAAGAAMVTLVEHAHDDRTQQPTALLLTSGTALSFVALAATIPTLQDYPRLRSVYQPVIVVMIAAAAASIALGLMRPAPLVLVIAVSLLPVASWVTAMNRWLSLGGTEPGHFDIEAL